MIEDFAMNQPHHIQSLRARQKLANIKEEQAHTRITLSILPLSFVAKLTAQNHSHSLASTYAV
jgi:starvation-inducible outer membrane lipoprotein